MVIYQCTHGDLLMHPSFWWFTNAPLLFSAMSISAPSTPDLTSKKMYALMTFFYVSAMLASNQALSYVSYPTQVKLYAAYTCSTILNIYFLDRSHLFFAIYFCLAI